MKYTRESFIKALGVSTMPDDFGKNFEKTMEEYDREGASYLSDEFIDAIQNEFEVYKEKYDFVKKEAKRVRENDLLARYSMLMKQMMVDKDEFALLTLPEVPVGKTVEETVDLEMAAYFGQFAFIPEMVEFYRRRGVPERIIADTLSDSFEGGIKVCYGRFGRDGYETNRSFMWNQHYLGHRILRIGVLNFELRQRFTDAARVFVNTKGEYKLLSNNQSVSARGEVTGSAADPDEAFVAEYRETETAYEGYEIDTVNSKVTNNKVTLPKSEWRIAVDEGDSVINVHIPESGGFNRENIEAAYRECYDVFTKCFPEFKPKAFTCFSWLMEPRLRELLGDSSNIVGFQSKYLRFPRKSGGKAVYTFLFRVDPDTKVEDFPENSSLQRKVKALYLNGEYIYEPCGVFMFDAIDR